MLPRSASFLFFSAWSDCLPVTCPRERPCAWIRPKRSAANSEHMQTFLQDLRFGLRMLRRSPGFSILAILCLTLGIGTNAAVLSWVEGILIRPYPLVAHEDRMFALNATTRGENGSTGLSYHELLDYGQK